jgi:ribosome-associated heat shock protein Hsp15
VTGPATLRLDKWLWYARLCKTRSLAARLCAAGAVELAGTPAIRPAQPVRVGDTLAIRHGGWRQQIEILALGERRGPAPEARLLYREIAAPARLSGTDPGWTTLFEPDQEDGPA